jgi:Fe2+ or Zn2+ uptake regulation protein
MLIETAVEPLDRVILRVITDHAGPMTYSEIWRGILEREPTRQLRTLRSSLDALVAGRLLVRADRDGMHLWDLA